MHSVIDLGTSVRLEFIRPEKFVSQRPDHTVITIGVPTWKVQGVYTLSPHWGQRLNRISHMPGSAESYTRQSNRVYFRTQLDPTIDPTMGLTDLSSAMKSKSYLALFLSLSLLAFLGASIFNYVVDPYRFFDSQDRRGINEYRQKFFLGQYVSKPYALREQAPEAVILGVSRAGSSLATDHPGW
ncbi:MAG: hypothetical protein AB8B81_11845, partial [Halioglobus sp.]